MKLVVPRYQTNNRLINDTFINIWKQHGYLRVDIHRRYKGNYFK